MLATRLQHNINGVSLLTPQLQLQPHLRVWPWNQHTPVLLKQCLGYECEQAVLGGGGPVSSILLAPMMPPCMLLRGESDQAVRLHFEPRIPQVSPIPARTAIRIALHGSYGTMLLSICLRAVYDCNRRQRHAHCLLDEI